MAEEDGRNSKRSQNTPKTLETRNLSKDGIEDACLKAEYIMKTKNMS
jgi:hypothetical protein